VSDTTPVKLVELGLKWDPPLVIDGKLCDGRWVYPCGCGRQQGYAPAGESGGVTPEEAGQFGWRRRKDGTWVCPICSEGRASSCDADLT